MNPPTSTTEPAGAPRIANERLFLLTLAFIAALTPLSVDMYLPALPEMARSLDATQGAVQHTLAAYLGGLGVGTLFWGPMGDRFGRRRPLFAGLSIAALAALVCALSTKVELMIVMRAIQALAGAVAGLGIAMVSDVYDRNRAARAMSLIQAAMLAAPMLAPIIGGGLLAAFGWRSIFWVISGSMLLGVAAASRLPDTLPPERRVRRSIGDVFGGYLTIVANRRYVSYALSSGFCTSGMFAYLAGMPFIYIDLLKVPGWLFGPLFAVNVGAMIVMNLVNARLAPRVGPDRMLRIGITICASMAVLLVIAGFAGLKGPLGVASFAIPNFFMIGAAGMCSANAASGAISQFRDRAGAAAALFSTMVYGFGSLAAGLVGVFADGTARPMVLVICACTVLAVIANRLGLRR